jgi:DNA helicase HerA-like ATPase
MERKRVGHVICEEASPSQSAFSFVVTTEDEIPIRQGHFVEVEAEEGRMIGMVVNLFKTNRYFMRAEAVKAYGEGLPTVYPTNKWEYLVAQVRVLGVLNGSGLDRASYPPSPGEPVYRLDGEELSSFLGFSSTGLEIGELKHHDLPVKLDLTRLFQKHVAILAMSGAGKSFCARTIIEQLLKRKAELGRPAAIVVDVHGEYVDLAEVPEYAGKVSVIQGNKMKIGVPDLNARNFLEFVPDMSEMQARELQQVINELRKEMKENNRPYGLTELMARVQEAGMNANTKAALLAWLSDLQSLGIFGSFDDPAVEILLSPGSLVVLNFKPLVSLRKKQILVTHIVRKLFELRKEGCIPPFILFLEEAHQFAPSDERAISKSAIEMLAREGRKFSASLVVISQRPVRLSTTVLSQAGTNIILRMTNPYDLDHIRKSSEAITSEVADTISSLPVGEALIVGEAVNFPIFVKIRKPEHPPKAFLSLEEIAKKYERGETIAPDFPVAEESTVQD